MRSDKELEKDQMKEKTEHMCKKMKKEDLKKVFDLISEKEELYLPVKNAEKTNFDLYTKDCQIPGAVCDQ